MDLGLPLIFRHGKAFFILFLSVLSVQRGFASGQYFLAFRPDKAKLSLALEP